MRVSSLGLQYENLHVLTPFHTPPPKKAFTTSYIGQSKSVFEAFKQHDFRPFRPGAQQSQVKKKLGAERGRGRERGFESHKRPRSVENTYELGILYTHKLFKACYKNHMDIQLKYQTCNSCGVYLYWHVRRVQYSEYVWYTPCGRVCIKVPSTQHCNIFPKR